MRLLSIALLSGLLISCANKSEVVKSTDWISANRVTEKTAVLPPPVSAAAYHLTTDNNPALLQAYTEYQRTGIAKTIETDQFIQFPYNTGAQPIIAASVLELTVISLENGEQINSVSSGDPLRWSYSLVYSGNGDTRQAHVMIKPSQPHISTDFFITTDRRAYLLKLVATANGKYMRNVRFWYPDTLQQQAQYNQNPVIAELPNMDVSQLNFDYQLAVRSSTPGWSPQRVFDDGIHTYIQLPASVSSADLPALFIDSGGTQEMVNYRFKTPYFIVDKIFSKAVLISGVGRQKQQVAIINMAKRGG